MQDSKLDHENIELDSKVDGESVWKTKQNKTKQKHLWKSCLGKRKGSCNSQILGNGYVSKVILGCILE